MVISHKYKFIYIRIPKNATQTIKTMLNPYIDEKIRSTKTTATIAKDNSKMKEYWNNYFKFAHIRNPWDRAVSQYHYFIEHYEHRRTRKEFVEQYPNFETFVKKYWLSRTSKKLCQSNWIFDKNDNIMLNYVDYFETLHSSLKFIYTILYIPKFDHLLHRNKSRYRKNINYRKYYNDETAEIIYDKCKKIIETFHYDFEKGVTDYEPWLNYAVQ